MASNQINSKHVEQFIELMNANDRDTYAYILSQIPNLADADQIAQDTRLRLWQQFDRYKNGTDFGAWARTIASYLVMAHYEKRSRDRLRFGESFLNIIQEEIEKRIDGMSSRKEALQECMKHLSQDHREMLLQYYSNDESREKIATSVGKTYAALRQAVNRIRVSLANCIDRRLQNASGVK